jgi:hypothetical protein
MAIVDEPSVATCASGLHAPRGLFEFSWAATAVTVAFVVQNGCEQATAGDAEAAGCAGAALRRSYACSANAQGISHSERPTRDSHANAGPPRKC